MIEVTNKYVKVVHSLDEAWTFVLTKTEGSKGTPTIQILPFWDYGDDPKGSVKFEASVSIHQSIQD